MIVSLPTVDNILDELAKKPTIDDLRAAETKEEMRAIAFFLVTKNPFDDNLLFQVLEETHFFLTRQIKKTNAA